MDRLVHYFLTIVSPKQTTRPDSIITCCRQVIPYLQNRLTEGCWKVVFVANRILRTSEDLRLQKEVKAIEIFKQLETTIAKGLEPVISEKERSTIVEFLSQPISERRYRQLNAYLTFVGKDKLWKTWKGIRELFEEKDLESVQAKIEDLRKYLSGETGAPSNKLTTKDIRLLTVALSRAKMLRALFLPGRERLYELWRNIEQFNESEEARQLSDSCMKSFVPGRVMFYDWSTNEIRDWHPFDCMAAVKHILYGRVIHLGVVVNNPQDEISISHVNGATGTHALHPVRYPMLGPISNLVELDISPLIPSGVSVTDRSALQQYFSEEFTRLASGEHPNITLEWNLWLTFFLGHKGLVAGDLSQIDLNVNQSQLCASYIGAIFLQAIHRVNQKLSEQGYEQKIEHPFGEYEIIDRVDILRLLYHWKRLGIMKAAPVDALASRFFTTPPL